jgi:hypothetical protein
MTKNVSANQKRSFRRRREAEEVEKKVIGLRCTLRSAGNRAKIRRSE